MCVPRRPTHRRRPHALSTDTRPQHPTTTTVRHDGGGGGMSTVAQLSVAWVTSMLSSQASRMADSTHCIRNAHQKRSPETPIRNASEHDTAN